DSGTPVLKSTTLKLHKSMNKNLLIPLWVWEMMRMSFYQIVLFVIFCGASYAHKTNGQTVLEKRVSLDVQDVRVKKVLSILEAQTDARFIYSANSIDTHRKVRLRAVNKRLDLVLKELLSPYAIGFSVSEGRMILLRRILEAHEGDKELRESAAEIFERI